jgi:hypothetical protein
MNPMLPLATTNGKIDEDFNRQVAKKLVAIKNHSAILNPP